ncbi:divergent PAP2 family protein [Carnobacterium maltaromaticum]|uniref:divergent PAP2 family protein n=1 Tax=Carnobacterium maltaromaticum TaxID=2751 RepID=UPI001071B52D|nr:divergent PAP2 family protein [Carnobacterium maltaromaticum]TFJ76032.1 hypothetical protein CKN94_04605 [Carnobacterium maltaromaticum]TFJ78973.1 hypothetical protein CKN97_04600 [Carnobacterium maltaromaticum]
MQILTNYPLIAALSAICFSQFIKVPIAFLLKKNTTWALAVSTGGMPSSHSAGVTALITALILNYGWESTYVAIAVTFGVIVMFDAMGVRRQSGEQGLVLNQLIIDLQNLKIKSNESGESPKRKQRDKHIKEYLGHKPLEVLFGIFTGIAMAYLVRAILNYFNY